MSLLPSASAAADTLLHNCSNFCQCCTEKNGSVLTDTSSITSSDHLIQQQRISDNFGNETVSSLPPLYSSKMNKTSLLFTPEPFSDFCSDGNDTDDILQSSYGSQENLEVQKYVWKSVQKLEEPINFLNGSKNYVPESNQLISETLEAVCDKIYPSGEVQGKTDGGDPKTCQGVRSTEYILDNHSTSKETIRVEDNGVEVAWMEVKKVKTLEGQLFRCSICQASFRSLSSVTSHLQEHRITKPFKCVWCKNTSQTESEAKVHHKSHKESKQFSCTMCDLHFSKQEKLERHKMECSSSLDFVKSKHQFQISNSCVENSSSSEDSEEDCEESGTSINCERIESPENYTCDECSKCFSFFDELTEHKANKHFCGQDDTKFVNLNYFSSSITTENNSVNNDAQILDENDPLKGTENPLNSRKKNSSKAPKKFECLTCGKSFRASKPLREHEVVHTGAREFPCEICGKAFGTRANMKIHLATHSDRKPYVCDVCNATFRQKDSLKVHQRKHNGERPFACTVCSMTFDRNFTLKNHLLTHGDERSHVCMVCGKAFTTRGGLNNHERLHSKDPSNKKARKPPSKPGTGNWICDECGKLYSTRSNLKMHKRSHEPVTVTHTCCVCGRVYKHKDSLEVHMRRHTDDRPYSCPTCGRTFYRNWTLKLHILTHTGEKPHKCPIEGCDKAFTQSSSLCNHIQNHHKTDRSKKNHVQDDAQCTPEQDGQLPCNTINNTNQSGTAIQTRDPLGNNDTLQVAPLYRYLVDTPDGTTALPDPVNTLMMPPTALNLDPSNTTLTGDDLATKVDVDDIDPSVLNGLDINGSAVEIPLIQRQPDILTPNPHLNLVTVDPVASLCHSDGSSNIPLVWDNSVLSMGLANLNAGPDLHLPETAPPPLQSLPQPLDQSLFILPDNVPLLVNVDGQLYQPDTQVKMEVFQNNFVSQLR